VNDTGIDGKQVFAGESSFTMKEIEVFSTSPQINSFSLAISGCPKWTAALTDFLFEFHHTPFQVDKNSLLHHRHDPNFVVRCLNA
jgi:hypothetical protein